MPAGLGGGGALALNFETTMGTFVQPTAAGTVWVPILSESLAYTEDRYYSPQIKKSTIVSDVKRSYYHVEGEIELEVDPRTIPYFLYAARHLITKTGAADPFTYKFVPSSAGSAQTGTGNNQRSLSLTVLRNEIGFGYAGCTVSSFEFRVEDGILQATIGIQGMSEEEPSALGTPTFPASVMFGADASEVMVAAAAVAPTFGAASIDFNGFTFGVEFNAEAQNRIRRDRAASYIAYGETEVTYDTELDFTSRTEYNNFTSATERAIRLEARNDGTAWADATRAFRVTANRSVYDSYEVGLGGMGDLIMASVTGRVIGIAGGDAYAIEVKSPTDIT